MGFYDHPKSMLLDSLEEHLSIALYAAESKGVSGYQLFPSATLLFAVIDAMGSFLRGNNSVKIRLDGKSKTINRDSEHYLVLNSSYFGLSLSEKEIDFIYSHGRSKMIHNSLIGKRITLTTESMNEFDFGYNPKKEDEIEWCAVGIKNLIATTRKAKEAFSKNIDAIFAASRQAKDKKINWIQDEEN